MFRIEMISVLTVLGLSCLLSAALTLLYRNLVSRIGLGDAPERERLQGPSIPNAGGLSVFLASTLSVFAFTQFGFGLSETPNVEPMFESLFIGACVFVVLGLIDAFVALRSSAWIAGQFLAISVLVYYGHLSFQQFFLFGVRIELGPLGMALTYLWMFGIINAISLIDGMDGLLGLIGILVCLSLGIVAALIGNSYVAIVSAALAGALIGFLRFNLPPASVRLGNSGSMLIGLVLGALSIQGTMKGPTAIALAVPMTILILPILDTAVAIARRRLTGRSIYSSDSGRLHDCLLRSGMSNTAVLSLIGILGLIASAGAVATTILHNEFYSIAAAAVAVIILIRTGLFGHAEFRLMKEKSRALVALLWNGRLADRSFQMEVQLRGKVRWREIWKQLTARAYQANFKTLCLDLNDPEMHEAYHARWDRFGVTSSNDEFHEWRADLPIHYEGKEIGRLSAVGLAGAEPTWTKLLQLAEMFKATEQSVQALIGLEKFSNESAAGSTLAPVAAE